MILDVNVATGRWPFQDLAGDTPARLDRLLSRTGIAQALVSPLEAVLHVATDEDNARLFRALRRSKRLHFIPVINPTLPQWPEILGGFPGRLPAVKVYPSYHGYLLTDPRMRALMRELSRRKTALLLPLRIEDERTHHPLMLVPAVPIDGVIALARAFPEVPILCCCPATDEAIALLKGGKNLHTDISYADGIDPVRTIATAGKRFARRILFGSHAPFFYVASALLKVSGSDISSADKQRVYSTNARQALRLAARG